MKLPLGYRYASMYAGIRKDSRDDLALIVSDTPAAAAGVFTRNRVQAAPVRLCRKHLTSSSGTARALLINAGNANCATRTGDKVALATSKALAKALRIPLDQVLPSSTGVIGVEMNGDLITNAIPQLTAALSADAFEQTAKAIMTTDLVPKMASAHIAVGGGEVRIAGMTKGSGMIHPLMGTTLGYIMTDAEIPAPALKKLLTAACERSYNRLSVDGDTSTNDTLILLANGASGQKLKTPADKEHFAKALTLVAEDLARQIARDGEGASKLVTIDVTGAKSDADAAKIARGIANSPLVKTAIAGSDPNWGRILSSAGNSGADFEPSKTDIYLQKTLVCKSGLAADFDEAKLKTLLDAKDISIQFKIRGGGAGASRFFTCDFTEGYIRINASYRT